MSLPTANGGNLLLGRGEIYVDKYVNGLHTGELFLGNCEAFDLIPKVDMKEKHTSTKAQATILKRLPVFTSYELKIEGDEFSVDNMEFLVLGTKGTLTQSTSSVTDEVLTSSANPGRYYPTAYRNISSVTAKNGVAGSTAMTGGGTDYTVDPDGRLYIEPAGSTAVGDIIKASYTYGTISGLKKLSGGTQSYIEAFIRFKGKPTSGPIWELQAWRVNLTPNGQLALIADDFGKWQLNGILLDDSAVSAHVNTPYFDLIQTGTQS